MGEAIMGIVWLILFSLGGLVMIIFLRKYTNNERMAMIEKGLNPADMKRAGSNFVTLRFALLFIGAGLGLLVGYFLDDAFRMEEVAYFSMLFVFGGAGLGLSYVIEERKIKERNG